jgi:hypothetical protein
VDIHSVLNHPYFWIIVAAASEIIGLSPQLKSNSLIQLLLNAIFALKPGKR